MQNDQFAERGINSSASTITRIKNTIMKRLLILLPLLLLLCPHAEASHIVGGDISYQHIEGNTYEVLVRVYRDCFYGLEDAQFDDPASVGIFDENNVLIDNLLIPQMTNDTLSAIFANPCLFVPNDVCVHTSEYRDTVTLAPLAAGESYTFVYQRCCRNQTITNLNQPDETGASYTITMSADAMAIDNSTPDFGQLAPIFICLGEPIDYDHSAIESDGDELVYSFCIPKTGASIENPRPQPPLPPPYDDVNFADGIGLTNLLGGGPDPMMIDPQTGFITGIPSFQGQYVVGVCVQEYRDGELIGTVRRDFQYNIGLCQQVASIVAAPEAQCDDLTVNFTNNSTEAEEFIWQFDFLNNPGITSTEISPSFTYPDTGTYTIRLISEPTKPCADTLEFEIYLQNNSLLSEFKLDIYDCDERSIIQAQDLSTDVISPVIGWDWVLTYGDTIIVSTEQNPWFIIPPGITGSIELTATSQNGCETTTSQVFVTGENNPVDLIAPNHQICDGESVELNPEVNADLDFTYTWLPSETLDDANSSNPTATPPVGNTTISVIASALDGECIVDTEVSIDVLQQPELAFDLMIDCDALTVEFNNQSQNANAVLWIFDDNGNTSTTASPNYTFSDFGEYEVQLMVAESELCRDTISQIITIEPRILDAKFTFEYSDCSEDDITIQFQNTSENSLDNTETYEWSFSNGTISDEQNPTVILTPEQTLTASLTITTIEGCTSTVSQVLNINFTELDLSLTPIQICLGTEQALNPNGNTAYQYLWSPATGLNDATAVNPIANPSTTTTYTVSVQNISADTCTITHDVTVFVPQAIELTASDDILICEDLAQISASSVIASDYVWTNGNGLSETTATIDINVSGTTVYTVVATDDFGCTETEDVTVEGGTVAITASGDAVICDDEALNIFVTNLDPNDNLTYSWTPAIDIQSGVNTANPTVTNEPGIYTFTVGANSQYGCEATEMVDAVIYDADAVFDFNFNFECNGATVEFANTSTSAFGYAWDFGVADTDTDVSTEESPSFTFPGPGAYAVTLGTFYDVDCVIPTTINVEIPDDLVIAGFSYAYEACETDEITINFTDETQNFLNNTISWDWTFSNGTTSDQQNPIVVIDEEQILTATLLITTADGCSAFTEQIFEIDFIEENTTAAITICYGGETELNPGGNGAYTYNWTPVASLSDAAIANPVANPLATTVYDVTITNFSADACSITRQITVTVTDQIDLSSTEDLLTCGETVTLTATTAASDLTIVWVDDNGDIYNGASIDVLPEAELTYIVTATNDFGCSEQDTTFVFNGNMDLTTQGERIICPTENLVIEAFNIDFSDVVDWQWEAGVNGTIISGGNTSTPTVSIDLEGVPVQYYVTATNQHNCTSQDSVTVTMSEFMPAFEAQVPVCKDVATPLNPSANDQYVYEWSPSTGLSDPNSPNPMVTLTENQIYTVTITDFQGIDTCFSIEMVEVIVNPLIELEAFGDALLCAEETVNISASSSTPTDFEWATDPTFTNIFDNGASVAVTPVGTQTYYVRATDDLGCTEESEVTISSYPLDFDLANSMALCFGESTEIEVTNMAADQDLTYQWSPIENIISGATSNIPEVNPDVTTIFYVGVTNQIGCTATDSTEIVVENLEANLFASATPDTILFGSGETSLLMTAENDSYKYDWQPESSLDDNEIFNPIASPEETTIYTVEIIGELGCITERNVEVVVVDLECREPFVFIPNAFTPNGDNENDVLYVRGSNVDEVFMTVFNRWGEKMFETNDKSIGWDGTFKNKQLPPDVYGYYMQIKCFNGMEYFKKGNITLIR
ncbi:MAG: gliding motility-associated-like protein [Saprospiraceae bacterium]